MIKQELLQDDELCAFDTSESEEVYIIRRALNYALWALENYDSVHTSFLEKANRTVFDLLEIGRNSEIEAPCLFIYGLFHEIIFSHESVSEELIQLSFVNIKKIAEFFNIEIPGFYIPAIKKSETSVTM